MTRPTQLEKVQEHSDAYTRRRARNRKINEGLTEDNVKNCETLNVIIGQVNRELDK